ncbi:peptidylprolyl isomerase [Gemmatimonas sp.]|uniref:peptidylprolyl isomerase n=1 Tax=Gemmatimonas sp. TaxID=1962908 RepID=UPI0022C2AC6C|nr:peptidylprolyl isomerase [Gemmatimonas sp.]MCZ8011988.1 peptidylprolyl isomerase [Gemmatimonas sp.]MCZ8267306.1 peptidylprolyl isomerase [Gemmatimonas sp.]
MKSYRLSVLGAVAFAVACGAASNPDVAATAGNQQLSAARLAEIVGQSQAPLEKDVARSIAELWVNYQLVALAAAKGDSLTDPKVMQDALWSNLDNIRVKKFYDNVSKGWQAQVPGSDEERYNSGEAYAARHILIKTEQGATPEQIAAAKSKAQGILQQATPANFVSLTARSDEPGAKERGGDLGLFGKGMMVPEFEKCVAALKPGEISKELCQSSFGFHIIYRSPYADVAEKFAPIAKQRNVAIAESTYLAKLEASNEVKVEANATVKAKAIAKNTLGYMKDNDAMATYKGGKLTASRFADWLAAYPPSSQIRPQLVQAPDTLVEKFVKQIVRNELVLRQADSAKATVDTAEMSNLFLNFKNAVTQSWASLGVEPTKLADSAKAAGGDKEKIAGAKVEAFFSKLVKNEVPFVDVPYPVARAVQKKYTFAINEAGLDKVIELAKGVRAKADSSKAQQGPPAAPGAPGAAAPGTPAPAPDTTKK